MPTPCTEASRYAASRMLYIDDIYAKYFGGSKGDCPRAPQTMGTCRTLCDGGKQLDPRGTLERRGIRKNARDGKEQANRDGTSLACVRVRRAKAEPSRSCLRISFLPLGRREGFAFFKACERARPPPLALILPPKDQRPSLPRTALPPAPQPPRPSRSCSTSLCLCSRRNVSLARTSWGNASPFSRASHRRILPPTSPTSIAKACGLEAVNRTPAAAPAPNTRDSAEPDPRARGRRAIEPARSLPHARRVLPAHPPHEPTPRPGSAGAGWKRPREPLSLANEGGGPSPLPAARARVSACVPTGEIGGEGKGGVEAGSGGGRRAREAGGGGAGCHGSDVKVCRGQGAETRKRSN